MTVRGLICHSDGHSRVLGPQTVLCSLLMITSEWPGSPLATHGANAVGNLLHIRDAM
jgi:hypothetical protein